MDDTTGLGQAMENSYNRSIAEKARDKAVENANNIAGVQKSIESLILVIVEMTKELKQLSDLIKSK